MTNDALTALTTLNTLAEGYVAEREVRSGKTETELFQTREAAHETIRQALKSLEKERRMCVNCGRTRAASEGRIAPGDDCPSPEACTWDVTDKEASEYWCKKAYDLMNEWDRLSSAYDQLALDFETRGKLLDEVQAERDRIKAKKWDSLHTDTMNEIASLRSALEISEIERDRLKADLAEACEVIKSSQSALQLHHKWQSSDETYGLELSPGQWIELNRGAEYADSSMCAKTTDALRRASQFMERVKQ